MDLTMELRQKMAQLNPQLALFIGGTVSTRRRHVEVVAPLGRKGAQHCTFTHTTLTATHKVRTVFWGALGSKLAGRRRRGKERGGGERGVSWLVSHAEIRHLS